MPRFEIGGRRSLMGTVSPPAGGLRSEGKKTGAGWPGIALLVLVAALLFTAARGYLKTKGKPSFADDRPPVAVPTMAASPISMNGWRDFRWGMSQAEVDEVIRLKKFGVEVRKNNDKGEPVIHLTGVSVGDFRLVPALHFGPRGLDFVF